MSCNQLSVTSDKIVPVIGEKYITLLTGEKGGVSLLGSVDKTTMLLGEKNIANFEVTTDKITNLNGQKYTDEMLGEKNINSILGSLDKSANLNGDGACVGWWYILVDTTLVTVDNTYITVDRTPTI